MNTKELLQLFQDQGYKFPVCQYISRMKETEKLYKAEDQLKIQIQKVCEEFRKLYKSMRNVDVDLYKECMPEVYRSILESVDERVSILAAISFLLARGFKIDREEKS